MIYRFLNYDLSSLLTKGLSVHGSIAYDSYYYSRKKYSKTFPYYLARRDAEDPDYIYLIPQSEESIWSVSTGWDKNRKVYMSLELIIIELSGFIKRQHLFCIIRVNTIPPPFNIMYLMLIRDW